MINWLAFILSVLAYAIALYFIKKKEAKGNDNTPQSIQSIIATPRNYIINVVENKDDINLQEYADVSINIRDILEKNNKISNDENKSGISPTAVISFENIDFSEFVNIKTKKDEN